MQRWILPFVLVVVAAFAAWQAVETDQALAEEALETAGTSLPPARTPLISVRRTPEYLRAPILIENLQESLDDVTETFPSQSCLVVHRDGVEIYADNPTLPLVPASAQKILTAYGVYEVLGADHTFETGVFADAAIGDGGIIDGNLYLIGGGDPLVATATYADRYDPPEFRTPIEQLADAVAAAGVTEITGAVLGDDTRYDAERYVPEWPPRFTNESQNQTGPLSALTVNDGFVQFDAANTAPSLATATTQPAAFAAAFFDDLLEERGVIIRQSAGAATEIPPGVVSIASLQSDPVSVVTNQMVSVSDNMGAELLLKEIGVAAAGLGTTDDGAAAIENALRQNGFTVAETDIVDGSGLASENRLSCQLLVEVLDASLDTPLIDGLAIAGETGTLTERMVGTEAAGKVKAKTGRLNEVGALAGTAEARDGSILTFAWIANTTDLYPVEEMMATQDAVALELVAFPEGPEVEALGPIR